MRDKELEQFRGVSEDWIKREQDYRAEIKRLELTLARESKDGMACVALTRHGSLVDRAASKRFRERLKRLSNQNDDSAGTSRSNDSFQHTLSGSAIYDTIEELVRSTTKSAREDPREKPARLVHYIDPIGMLTGLWWCKWLILCIQESYHGSSAQTTTSL